MPTLPIVVIVVDEEMIRGVLERSLEGMSCRVISIPDKDGAKEVFEELGSEGTGDNIVLCFDGRSDGVPNAGAYLAAEAEALLPEAIILNISGSPDSSFGDAKVIPLDMHKFQKLVRRLLD